MKKGMDGTSLGTGGISDTEVGGMPWQVDWKALNMGIGDLL